MSKDIKYCVIKVVFDAFKVVFAFNYYYITVEGVEINSVTDGATENTVYQGNYEQCDKRKAELYDEDNHSFYNMMKDSIEEKKIRLSIDVTPQMKKVIDDLSEVTQAETFRKAIALLWAIKKDGESVAMIKDNKIVARLVGI